MTCVYTGAVVYVECHNCVVPADLHEVGGVTIVAMPKPLDECAQYGEEAVRRHTHVLYDNGGVWLHQSRYTPIIAVLSDNVVGPRR